MNVSRTTGSKKFKRYEPPSPSYCSEDELERDEYFIGNPELEFDELPQPFRFIDRVLQELLDRVSEEIVKVEELRELHRNATSVPTFKDPQLLDCSALNEGESSLHLSSIDPYHRSFVNGAVHISSTENFIFVAKGKFILSINSVTRVSLAQIKLDTDSEISLLQTICIPSDESELPVIAVFAFDDSGKCFSFVYNNKIFIPIKVLEDNKIEASKVVKWQYCSDLSLVCIFRQPNEGGAFVEIYRVPKEMWVNDFQNVLGKLEDYEKKDNNEELMGSLDEIKTSASKTAYQEEEEGEAGNSLLQKSSHSISATHVNHMILLATIMAPNEVPCAAFTSTLKTIDTGKIGSGSKHILSSSFFESLKHQMRKDLSKLELSADIDSHMPMAFKLPTIHFLKRIGNKDLKASNSDVASCCHELLGIWWPNRNNFMVYKIPKSSRDGDFQLEIVYPNADAIIKSCVNTETNLVALMLRNGNTVVLNRASDEHSRIIQFYDIEPVFMEFATISGEDERLIIGCQSGTIKEVNCNDTDFDAREIVDNSMVGQNEIVFAQLVPGCKFLLFVAKKPNYITVFNLLHHCAIFQFQLPDGIYFDSHISECFTFSQDLSSIVAQGKKEVQSDVHLSGLFLFNLCIGDLGVLSGLSEDLSCFAVQDNKIETLETVAISLMEEINLKRKLREQRQKIRWEEYAKELDSRV